VGARRRQRGLTNGSDRLSPRRPASSGRRGRGAAFWGFGEGFVVVAFGRIVRVRVGGSAMLVKMLMDQIGPNEQIAVGQHGGGRAVGNNSPCLAENYDPIGDQRHYIKLVCGDDQGSSGLAEALHQIDEDPLRAWIE
jgi:hypothetical protein